MYCKFFSFFWKNTIKKQLTPLNKKIEFLNKRLEPLNKQAKSLNEQINKLYWSGLSFAFYLEMSLVFIIGSFQTFFYFLSFKYGTIFNNF